MDSEVEFAKLNQEEVSAVGVIISRARAIAAKHGVEIDRLSLQMDIQATHAQIPLRLKDLSEADDFNLSHDVFGIMRHIDRSTGKMGDHFLPRYSA